MIRITGLKTPYDKPEKLRNEVRKALMLADGEKFDITIRRKSFDTRKKPRIVCVYTVDVTIEDDSRFRELVEKNTSLAYVKAATFEPRINLSANTSKSGKKTRPIVCGFGPAGIFAGYILAKNGASPLILERGEAMEGRVKTVNSFFDKNTLSPSSNVCFGEGGAGTFSDGKLNTGIKDLDGCGEFILKTLVDFGAPSEILYDARPHLGTDKLRKIIPAIRDEIISQGGEIRFNTALSDIVTEGGSLTHIKTENGDIIPADSLILAIGHSSRDTYEMLLKRGIYMEPKAFSAGFRIEHPQELIDRMTYGKRRDKYLPPASYKVSCTDKVPGRGIYSFCMCPGGYVVNSSTEEGRLCVNGMSYSGRSSGNSNSAIAIAVTPDDFKTFSDDTPAALSGIAFQRELEKKAFLAGSGYIPQQLYADFKDRRKSTSYGSFTSSTKGGSVLSNLRGILPDELEKAFIAGMESFASRWFPGFAGDDVILSGIEARTSSPVRIKRDEMRLANIKGIYPCGEGAGYAGGITSAAVDGVRCAMALLEDTYGR